MNATGKCLTGLVALALLAAPLSASAQQCRGPSRSSRRHRDARVAVGALAAGVVIGHLMQGSTVHHTREVVYAPAYPPPPPPVYYAPPPPKPIIIHSSHHQRLYQPPVHGHPAFVQVWNGYSWQTVGSHPSVY